MALNKQDVIERARAYLRDLHAKDPVRHPATVKAIAAHLDVSRGTFYNWIKKGDPDIDQLVKDIEQADGDVRGAPSSLSLRSEHAPAAQVASTAELEREMLEALNSIAWKMRSFVSMVDNMESTAEAPAIVKQMEATLRQINAAANDLTVPYGVWYDRKKEEPGTAREEDRANVSDPVLDLDFTPPGSEE